MKYFLFLLLLFFGRHVAGQYPGPIMDSLNKYQELIKNAKTQDEKIRLALKIQKIISGKSAIDTAAVNHLPKNKEEALQQAHKQVADLNKLKQNFDTARLRQNKYTVIQKLQGKNDSNKVANKDASKHAVLQDGLITLPNAEQFLMNPLALVDTGIAIIHCMSRRNDHGSIEVVELSSTTATLYRQNGIIKILATNSGLPEFVTENNNRLVKMVAHNDISGSASRSPFRGESCITTFKQTNKFDFVFYYNPASKQMAAGCGGGLYMLKVCTHAPDTSMAGVGFSCTNDPSTWIIAGQEGPNTVQGNFGTFTKTERGFHFSYSSQKDGVSQEFSSSVETSPPRYEAFIEPTDTTIYRKWLPQGPDLSAYPILHNAGRGNEINLKISVWDNKAQALAADPYTTTIKLNNVS